MVINAFSDSTCPNKGQTKMYFGYVAETEDREICFLGKGYVTSALLNSENIIEDIKLPAEDPLLGTNNAAEYYAMILLHRHVMAWVKEKGLNPKDVILNLFTDSHLMYNQVVGKWRVKHQNLLPLYSRMLSLQKVLPYTLHWIEREKNELANQLSTSEFSKTAFNEMPLQESIYRANAQSATKAGATTFPAFKFVRDYLLSDLPKLKRELEEAVTEPTDVDTNEVNDCLSRIREEIGEIRSKILVPQEKVSFNSRRKVEDGISKHQAAGLLASEAVALLDENSRAQFNGTFISIITSIRKAHKDITAEALADLARRSIAYDPQDPQFWLRNLARLWNPMNFETVNTAIIQLEDSVNAFEQLLQEKDYVGLRDDVSLFFNRLFSDRSSHIEILQEEISENAEEFKGTFEDRNVW